MVTTVYFDPPRLSEQHMLSLIDGTRGITQQPPVQEDKRMTCLSEVNQVYSFCDVAGNIRSGATTVTESPSCNQSLPYRLKPPESCLKYTGTSVGRCR